MEMRRIVHLDILIAAMVALVTSSIFGIVVPAEVEYNFYYDRHVQSAYNAASFLEMEIQVVIIWHTMVNFTFAGRNFDETFCTPWFWERTYNNSLAAQNDRLRQLVDKISSYEDTWQKLQTNSTDPTTRVDWYYKTIQGLGVEMRQDGGLDRVIRGAWFLTYAPAAYWLDGWLIPVAIILTIIAIILTSYIIFHSVFFL